MAEENPKRQDGYPDASKIITLIVGVYLILYLVAAWNPAIIYFFFDVEPSAVEGGGKFGLLGTIGDFFGGTVNPILTFISIWLLIHSIRIQRDEMRAATVQAEKSASAAKHAILVSKISERPFVTYYQETGVDPFICVINEYILSGDAVSEGSSMYYYDFGLMIKNIGKSFSVIKSIEIVFLFDVDGRHLKIANSYSTPLGAGMHDTLRCVKRFTLGESSYSEFREGLDSKVRVSVSVGYEDSFNIKYKTNFNAVVRGFTENSIEFYVLRQSFECGLNLDDDPAVEG